MLKASELKKGQIIEIDNKVYSVNQLSSQSPSARGASTIYKIRCNEIKSKQKLDLSVKSDELFKEADLIRRKCQFLYKEGDSYTFMDDEDYSQHTLNADDLGDLTLWLIDGLQGVMALILEGQIIGVELPQSIEMEVVETTPVIKGATAQARTKLAVLASGIEIQVPEYLDQGEIVKVNTQTGEFMKRV